MKSILVGLIFLGYFQAHALDCPYGNTFELSVTCEPGGEALALDKYSAKFNLDIEASDQLIQQGSSEIGIMCVYKPETFKADYTFTDANGVSLIEVDSEEGISDLLTSMNEKDPNFPGWYNVELLMPEFRFIEALDIFTKKNKLKIGVGMTFNGRIALEKTAASHHIAVTRKLDPVGSLYVIAQNCTASIVTPDNAIRFVSF